MSPAGGAPPPAISTSEPGSFARDTLARRVPEILADTRARLGPIPPTVAAALDKLARELTGGALRGLREEARDRAAWDRAVAFYLGRSWLDIPWYLAESFFYRRLLEATGYFQTGSALAGRDPFASHKAQEWDPEEGPRRCAELLAVAPAGPVERLRALLLGSLWGNRADLSYNVARELGTFVGEASDLLVDDSPAVVDWITSRAPRPIAIILDNAGTELLMDLALADHLLGAVGAPQVELAVKDHPFFVSDTIAADVEVALKALAASRRDETEALGARLQRRLDEGRLVIATHPFYTSSLHYPQMPADLREHLAGFDLTIVKGDANYRRLCSDAHWAPETPFAEVVATFPTPVCALRTLKAEVIVGLAPGVAEKMATEDARWMVNGRRGVVQARLP